MLERRALISSSRSRRRRRERPVLAATAADAGPDLQPRRGADPRRELRLLPSGQPDRADVAAHLRRGPALGEVDRARTSQDGTMPPWHADPAFGQFANDRRLEAEARSTRSCAGSRPARPRAIRPTGRRRPSSRTTSGSWASPTWWSTLEEVSVPAGKTDLFPKLIGRVMLPEDRWIQAVEFRARQPQGPPPHHRLPGEGLRTSPTRRAVGSAPGPRAPTRWCSRRAPAACSRRAPTSSADMHYHPTDTDE